MKPESAACKSVCESRNCAVRLRTSLSETEHFGCHAFFT